MRRRILRNIIKYNCAVWDNLAKSGSRWTLPVDTEIIKQAQAGTWSVHITKKPLPSDWLPKDIQGKKILCLASAGGQQAPVLAAAGADVTVVDISLEQLAKDEFVAKRDGLMLRAIQADMTDLNMLEDNTFDYIVSPISNLYIPDLTPLWTECYRVLVSGGILLASFYNPVLFIFERSELLEKQGLIKPNFILPYSDIESLSNEKYQQKLEQGEAIIFGHTLSQQIGLQMEAGFLLAGFYEDQHPTPRFIIEKYMDTLIATKAIKP
ncbi:methyltransferase [Photobacterium angustum]|nr:methyltransferase [Photobacterium angustum]